MGINKTTILQSCLPPKRMPDFVGKTIHRVEAHLRAWDERIQIEVGYQDNDGEPGLVLSQTPGVGESIRLDSEERPRVRVVLAEQSWLHDLPRHFREQAQKNPDIEQWLFALQAEYNQLLLDFEMGTGSKTLDPLDCPENQLGSLSRFVGRPYLSEWPALTIRRVLAARWELDAWRGTRRGLTAFLRLLLPDIPTSIRVQARASGTKIGLGRLGVNSRLQNQRCDLVIVSLTCDEESFQALESKLGRALNFESPVNETIHLQREVQAEDADNGINQDV
jgi:phage tail-like protein